MTRRRSFIAAALVAGAVLACGHAAAVEKLGVVAVADPPHGPDADLAELAHQLRAACRDRAGGVEEVSTMRARLLGQGSSATVSELDRAYGGALAVYQNGEFESAHRTLRAIVEDLEALPEGEETYFQWTRALVRLAHTANTVGRTREMEAALAKLARTDPALQPDPDQYSPSFRRKHDEVRARVKALPRRKLTVVSEGSPGTVFVNGRAMGTTPLTLTVPSGTYRIGGAAEKLRVPSFEVDLEGEDRTVVLDFALADSLRLHAGPGLALAAPQRAYAIVRAGAWLGVDRLIVVSRADEGQAQFLLGSLYDVRRGAMLREGSVRMVAGGVPSVNLAALASFLLTGQSSREVKDRTQDLPRELLRPIAIHEPAGGIPGRLSPPPESSAIPPVAGRPTEPPPPALAARPEAARPSAAALPAPDLDVAPPPVAMTAAPATLSLSSTVAPPIAPSEPTVTPDGASRRAPPRWVRPAALGSGVLALGLTGLAVQQGLSASGAYSDAEAMLGAGGVFRPGSDPDRYRALRSEGDAAVRNTYVSAGAALALAAAAGVLGFGSWGEGEDGQVAFRF